MENEVSTVKYMVACHYCDKPFMLDINPNATDKIEAIQKEWENAEGWCGTCTFGQG